MYTIGYRFVDL